MEQLFNKESVRKSCSSALQSSTRNLRDENGVLQFFLRESVLFFGYLSENHVLQLKFDGNL
ncbi:hypothetical protein KY285_016413 [Solanum tuberosum]|nr:hypothetical protein KY284_016411 [Solanum tuberosum]KAH0702135.1 hypothetical protein KY285_016413 [Solanum tuberosum]